MVANDLRNVRVCKTWILRYDTGLMMLAIKDESYKETKALAYQRTNFETKEMMTQASDQWASSAQRTQ